MESDSSSSKCSILDKKASSNTNTTDFLTSITATAHLQPFPSKILTMPFHHQHSTTPFLPDNDGADAPPYMYPHQLSPSFGNNSTILQPFHNFHPSYSNSGGGMATGFPFTAGQWKELERQAMIYKCMISSVPVPANLLFPLSTLDSSVPLYGGRYSRKGDPEPGRCKRTDGKKWRCSREVAPQQKYCERHLHRGRPRSRKPVEPKNNAVAAAAAAAEIHKKTRLQSSPNLPLLKPKTTTPHYTPTNRDLDLDLDLMMGKQPWESLMEANMGLSDYNFDQQPLNLFCYPETTGFIDIDNLNRGNRGSVESSGDLDLLPSLNLSMAMAVGNVLDDQMRNIQTDWTPGGPLAEALQPGSVAVGGSNPPSPYNSISTPATTISSPSGVLHWTLFPNSDGSVCNSPTFADHWHI